MTSGWPRPDVCLVTLAGELDMATAPHVRDQLRRHTAGRPATLVLDLRDVTFLGAAGLTVLVEAARGANGIHGRLHDVAPPRGPVPRPLRLTGVDAELRIHPDVDTALAAAARPA